MSRTKVKCQGSDCVIGERWLNPDEVGYCARCGKPVCRWCLVHCDPSHSCEKETVDAPEVSANNS